jgi:hypothetical protein
MADDRKDGQSNAEYSHGIYRRQSILIMPDGADPSEPNSGWTTSISAVMFVRYALMPRWVKIKLSNLGPPC